MGRVDQGYMCDRSMLMMIVEVMLAIRFDLQLIDALIVMMCCDC